jgi:hypothetical protein
MGVTIIMMLLFASQIIYTAINLTASNISTITPTFFAATCQTAFVLMLC